MVAAIGETAVSFAVSRCSSPRLGQVRTTYFYYVADSTCGCKDYEALPWEYSFNAHHDMAALVRLSGGSAAFARRLDMTFMPGKNPRGSDAFNRTKSGERAELRHAFPLQLR